MDETANKWEPVTENNGTRTTGTQVTITDGEFANLKVILTATSAEFYANNTLQETISTNIPTIEKMGASMGCVKDGAGGDPSDIQAQWISTEYGAE